VREAVDLRADRGVDLVVGVADGDGQDAAEEVEIFVSVRVLDPQSLRLRGHDRLGVVLDGRGEEVLLVLLAGRFRQRGGWGFGLGGAHKSPKVQATTIYILLPINFAAFS
jgi:hypothetical protein